MDTTLILFVYMYFSKTFTNETETNCQTVWIHSHSPVLSWLPNILRPKADLERTTNMYALIIAIPSNLSWRLVNWVQGTVQQK